MTVAPTRVIEVCFLLTGILVAASMPAISQTDHGANVSTTLGMLERLKFEAQQGKDKSALNAMLDDTAMLVDPNGNLKSKSEYLAGLRQSGPSLARLSLESMNVIVFEQMAIVVGVYEETGIEADHAYHQRCRFIDTWAFRKGRWVCIASTATSTVR